MTVDRHTEPDGDPCAICLRPMFSGDDIGMVQVTAGKGEPHNETAHSQCIEAMFR